MLYLSHLSHLLVKYQVRSFILFCVPSKHGHSEDFYVPHKTCNPNGSENMAVLKVTFPIKKSVVIFSMFAADRHFGTYTKLFLEARTVEIFSPFLNAYNSKPGPRL